MLFDDISLEQPQERSLGFPALVLTFGYGKLIGRKLSIDVI